MKKIWIVDDDQEMSNAMSMMFAVKEHEPDIVLLDINMPEVSGMDLLEFMRRRNEWNELPIIMLSTEAADVTVDKAMSLGANGYVMKPVTLEELEKTVNTAFEMVQKG